jgi:hypothetical protein
MNMTASGRSALIIAVGLWMCFAGPTRATESDARASDSTAKTEGAAGDPVVLDKFAKHGSKKHASTESRKSSQAASKPSSSKKATDADAAQDSAAPSNMPPAVANARAQAGDSPADNAVKTMSAQAENVLRTAKQGEPANAQADASAADTELVSADQLNEVDRSLSDDKAAAPTLTMAVAQAPTAASNDDSTWNQTSLIGKIFIAFGGLLTFASAARMFMA